VAPEPARGPSLDSLFELDRTRGDSVAALGPADGSLAFLAPNVAFLRAGVPFVYGRDSVRALFGATRGASAAPSAPHWEPIAGGVSYDLRSAYTYGVTVRVGSPRGEVRFERYIAYWERQRGRPWAITAYAEVDGPTATGVQVAKIDPPDASRELPRPIADAVAKVRATDSLFSDLADREGIPAAFAQNVADYGAIFGPQALVIGPKAVRQYFAAQGAASSLSWRPVYASVAVSLDLAFTIGEYTATSRGASGAAIQRFGKYLTVWKREPDGTWKFMIDGGNGTPAKPE
jgi:ketosteroid isomerase-like protein